MSVVTGSRSCDYVARDMDVIHQYKQNDLIFVLRTVKHEFLNRSTVVGCNDIRNSHDASWCLCLFMLVFQ